MALAYKSDVLTSMISKELDLRPRGAKTRLAEATGVTPQTITKWSKGEVQPEPERWPLIEQFFGWDPGEIVRRVVPAIGTDTVSDLVLKLAEDVAALAGRVAKLEARPSRSERRAR